MGQYTSYWLYQKYETRGSQEPIPCYPNVYSVDGDGTMPLVVRKEDDTQCGYVPPIVVKYRWVNIPITQDFICDECSSLQFRWIRSDDTICIEEEPQTIYRWVNMDASVDYYCEDTTKYYKQKKQVSYDSGLDWEDVIPYEYQKGDVVETESFDCGYVPTGMKLFTLYSDGRRNKVDCNESSTLSSGETRPSGYNYYLMTNAVIGDCVTTIGDSAFETFRTNSLTSVTISDSVTSIGSNAFRQCSGLTSVTLGTGLTSIGYEAFYYNTSLTSVTLGTNLTSIGEGAFGECGSLTNVIIPDSVTSIGDRAFIDCRGLTSATIGSGITSLTGTFMDCHYLDNVVVPRTVKELHRTFSDCSGMTNVTISDGVETIGTYAFSGCFSLSSVTIPDSVTTIGYGAFEQLSNGGDFPFSRMLNVTIGSGVTSIGEEAFHSCTALTSITINATTPPTLGKYAFNKTNNCPIYVPCESVDLYKSASGWSTYANRIRGIQPCYDYRWINMDASVDYYCEGTTKYYKQKKQYSDDYGETWKDVIPYEYQKGDVAEEHSTDCGALNKLKAYYSDSKVLNIECNDSTELTSGETKPSGYQASAMTNAVIGDCVTTIGESAFSGCSSLTSVNIPSGVTTIGNSGFEDCSGLTSVIIPDSVASIGEYAFQGCRGLTSINIPSGVTSIEDSVFQGCRGLTSIDIPNNVTSIGGYAFSYCTSLTSVTIPNSVTSIVYYAFEHCESLTSVTIPSGITSISNGVFNNCTSLASVTIPDSVTSIGERAFSYCSGLTSITIPDSVTSIGEYAFNDCSGLTSVTIGSGVTSIGRHAFTRCTNLSSIVIPNNVTSINYAAFSGCTSLTSVTVNRAAPPTLGTHVFDNNGSGRKIYVPSASVDRYKSATYWKNYASSIYPIS